MPWRNVPNTCEQTTAIKNLYHNVTVTYLTTYGQWHIYHYKQLAMDMFQLTISLKYRHTNGQRNFLENSLQFVTNFP